MAEIHYMTQEGLDKLKKDLADALALTFAAPVASREQVHFMQQKTTYEVEWNV